MALVLIAALLMAAVFLVLRGIGQKDVPLFPAIVINYLVAFTIGMLHARPWQVDGLSLLWGPAALEGALFIGIFHLMGVSARKVGVAITTVASKMSLAVTVAIAVLVFHEQPGIWGWIGILLGLAGVVLTTRGDGTGSPRDLWLPVIVFLGGACTDTVINVVQRTRLTPDTEAVFTTFTFGAAAMIGVIAVLFHPQRAALGQARTWIAGTILGIVNYGSIHALVHALAASGMPSTHVFPLLNIATIIIGTGASMLLFRERLRPVQGVGILLCVAALLAILSIHR
jgi:drug/metabolite transporter (DMT)-like permease